MKELGSILSITGLVLFLCLMGSARPAAAGTARSDAGEQAPAETNMSGRLGIGGGFPGIGIRYWFSDRVAVDSSVGLSWDSNGGRGLGIGGTGVFVLKKSSNLRFLGLAGLTVSRMTSGSDELPFPTKSTATSYNIGLGVGAEYFFHELPEISFGAFVTGLGIDVSRWKQSIRNTTVTNSTTRISTSPSVSLQVRYYFM